VRASDTRFEGNAFMAREVFGSALRVVSRITAPNQTVKGVPTMKRAILGVAVVLALGVTVPVSAQTLPARSIVCLDCGAVPTRPPFPLHGYIDSPDWRAIPDYFVGFPISGWEHDCRTGEQPPFVAVTVKEVGDKPTRWITNYTIERGISRPDVRNAYMFACPAIGTNEAFGYTLRINEVLPPGVYSLTVFWTTGDAKTSSDGRFVLVHP
jgi:hypothetical protein